jgi:hypothetical protein
MKYRIFPMLLALAALAQGCYTYRYDGIRPELKYQGTRKVAVAVFDQRDAVLSGDRGPEYVGVYRGGFGNPWTCNTASGKPLAQEMGEDLTAALSAKGFGAKQVVLEHSLKPQAAFEKISALGADRILMLTLMQWTSDSYMGTHINHDISLRVMNPAGKTLAQADKNGKTVVGVFNPFTESAIRSGTQKIFEELLNDPEIMAALK